MLITHLNQTVHGSFVLQVFRRCLCAIALQLFLESFRGVNALRLGFRYFEFEIDEHVQVLVHGLGIHGSCLVVFLVDVEELLCTHFFTIDNHQRFFCPKTQAHRRCGYK